MEDSKNGTIFVQSAYAQPGRRDQGIYAFAVRIDGRYVGSVLPQGSSAFAASSGNHQVRVGLMWFKSRPLSVMVPAGGQVVLRADVNGKLNSPSLLIRGLFTPFNGLRLEQLS
ncbi:MAG: hypothetical protein J2P28_08470 [Actinobacteria bacterium]|nr:hypothetical protein [Actinomycetota bacterium]